jgi:hypothetical protein
MQSRKIVRKRGFYVVSALAFGAMMLSMGSWPSKYPKKDTIFRRTSCN